MWRTTRLVTLALPLVLLLGCAGDEEPDVDESIEVPDIEEGDADGPDPDDADEPDAGDEDDADDEPGDTEPVDGATEEATEPDADEDDADQSAGDDGTEPADDGEASSPCRQEGDVWMYEDGDELVMFGEQSACEHYAAQ
jgi:hypothetical protein